MDTNTQDGQDTLIKRLFAVGAHFGFTRSRRHPTVRPYIFGSKHGTDIFDLEKTEELLTAATRVIEEAGKVGKQVLFVGTKEEISDIVKRIAEETGVPYVTNRWIGGALTNFSEIKKRLARLSDLTAQGESGELERKYTKKERVIIGRELEKLHFNFDGIKTLDRVPSLLVVVDTRHNHIAVREATELGIPVIGITSSDADISLITHPIVMNDSLQASVSLTLRELASAYLRGKSEFVPKAREEFRKRP